MDFRNTLAFAESLDKQDPLRSFRDEFFIPLLDGRPSIYFAGNSLGLQPRSVARYVQQELSDWARLGVEGHLQAAQPWLPYHEIFPSLLSRIIGCRENEVVAMNSLTVNLHLLLVSFYRPNRERYKIICEARAFPSDQYAFESQARFHGLDPAETIIEVSPRKGESYLRTADIVEAIRLHGNSTALVLFGAVNYYSGQFFDLPAITKAAKEAGAYAGFDLAHAVGNVELKMHDWDVDFACWCSYKYLNSGPGGVGGIYIHEKHVSNRDLPRFAGWWGYTKKTRFKMEKGFEAIPTAEGWQLSNAPILSMAAHKASLDIFERAGMENLHAKRKRLTGFLHFILQDIGSRLPEKAFTVITPASEEARGCQVSLLMKERGKQVFDALTGSGIVGDWREPDVIRVAPVPLYNTFAEVWHFGDTLEKILHG